MTPEQNKDPTPGLEHAAGPARPFLPRLCDVVREELRIGTLVRPDCCILATACLLAVLDYHKLTARPLSVIATVFNPTMSERIAVEGMPTPEQAEDDWFPNGCWSLAVGAGNPEPGKWPGHLVCVLGGKVLIDLTLDQANRLQHAIELPMPIIAPVHEDFLGGDGELVGLVNGCRVVYLARPDDRSFERLRDWTVKKRRDPIVGTAIRRLKREF